jgi:hypothetical protein
VDASSQKRQAHELIERLEPEQLSALVRILQQIIDAPLATAFAHAATDDEPVSQQQREAIGRSEAWFRERGGKGIPMEEVLAEFGLTPEDFPADPQERGRQD